MSLKELYLCYVGEDLRATFVDTEDFSVLHTDDWDDQTWPGGPYESDEYDQITVFVEGEFSRNSRDFPDEINEGNGPWLTATEWADEPVRIQAKVTLEKFILLVRRAGGEVYFPSEWYDEHVLPRTISKERTSITEKPEINWREDESQAYQCPECSRLVAVEDPNEYGTTLRCVDCNELMLQVARRLASGETDWIPDEYQEP